MASSRLTVVFAHKKLKILMTAWSSFDNVGIKLPLIELFYEIIAFLVSDYTVEDYGSMLVLHRNLGKERHRFCNFYEIIKSPVLVFDGWSKTTSFLCRNQEILEIVLMNSLK